MAAEDGKKHGGGGHGGGDRKRRRAKYLPHNQKKAVLSHGQQGFLVTCVGGKERSSIQEIINVLDEFLERPRPCSSTSTPANSAVRVEEAKNGHAAASQEASTTEQEKGQNLLEDRTVAVGASEHSEEGSGDDGSDESDDEGARKLFKLPSSAASTRNATAFVREDTSSRGGGIDKLLAAEIDELRNKKKARFVGCETGCHGVVFIRMHKDGNSGAAPQTPMDLAEAIVRDAAVSKKSRTRYSMRLLPVEVTCYASAAELEKAAVSVVARHFPTGQGCPSFKFAVAIEARANTSLDKMELINAVAKIVPKPHSVDLKNPDKTILLQIVKTTCAMGVVRDFKELAKYNLRQLTQQDAEKKQPTSTEGQANLKAGPTEPPDVQEAPLPETTPDSRELPTQGDAGERPDSRKPPPPTITNAVKSESELQETR